jgi:hypothetical protein
MAYLPDNRDPQGRYRQPSTGWILGAVAVVLLLVAAWAYIAAEGERVSASIKMPGERSLLNEPGPDPVPPRERGPRKSEPI